MTLYGIVWISADRVDRSDCLFSFDQIPLKSTEISSELYVEFSESLRGVSLSMPILAMEFSVRLRESKFEESTDFTDYIDVLSSADDAGRLRLQKVSEGALSSCSDLINALLSSFEGLCTYPQRSRVVSGNTALGAVVRVSLRPSGCTVFLTKLTAFEEPGKYKNSKEGLSGPREYF